MEYLRLNNTDLEISRIGFGCWAIGGHGYGYVDDEASIDAIHAALDLGINCFDTSDVYGFGHSETVLGKALGSRAKDMVVATKCGVGWDEAGRTYKDCSRGHIVKSVEASLKRLGLEAIPLLQINWYDGVTPLGDIAETLAECRRAGKIRYAGFCNMPTRQLGVHQGSFVSSQMEYGLYDRQNMAELAELQKNGVAGLVYGVLSRGFLSGKYDANARFGEGDTRGRDSNYARTIVENLQLVERLKVLGEKYGKSPAQLAIRWALESPGVSCALVGMKSKAQAVENAGAADWTMSRADWDELAGASPGN